MQTAKPVRSAEQPESDWIISLRDELAGTDQVVQSRLRATLSCQSAGGKLALFVPPEMAEDQPEVLEYLHAFAASQKMGLIEDRRHLDLTPIVERRKKQLPNLALGISLLLKQTGMPGPTRSLSSPHVLNKGNLRMDIGRMIRVSAQMVHKSRKVIFLPNRFIRDNLDGSTETMNGYACKVITDDDKITLVQFETDGFHAIGYISNDQFVVTVFLAGGVMARPQLWTSMNTLMDSPFRFQLFESPFTSQQVGLCYQTYYIDLEIAESDNQLKSQSA